MGERLAHAVYLTAWVLERNPCSIEHAEKRSSVVVEESRACRSSGRASSGCTDRLRPSWRPRRHSGPSRWVKLTREREWHPTGVTEVLIHSLQFAASNGYRTQMVHAPRHAASKDTCGKRGECQTPKRVRGAQEGQRDRRARGFRIAIDTVGTSCSVYK